MEVFGAGTDAAGAGGTEGNNGYAAKIIAFQKGVYNFRRLAPPDRVAQKHHSIVFRMVQCPGNGRPGIWVVLFPAGPAVVAAVIEIVVCIRFLGDDLIEVGIQDGLDVAEK